MDGYCRGCLNKFADPLDLLQYNEERRRLFVYSTGLQVKRNDVFTFQLCKECYCSMKMSCKFKKMCRTSDKKIRNYVSLKDVDDSMDFNTFLKRNEESSMFRLPILSGSSTPANHKAKDDDNESTCTSIQNFMTDILRADEIEDSEARIIKEVIEEEADVLEDSLDSHWLEDDAVDEYRLDLSLSRFSTPRFTNQDRMTSPQHRENNTSDITSGEDYDNIPIDISLMKLTDPVDSACIQQHVVEIPIETKKSRCFIDKNLEKALKDENNQEFSLQELLASPVFPSKSGASTPTIKHIIFGDKGKNAKKSKSPKFESELDLFIGKLGKGMKSQEQFKKGKHTSEVHKEKAFNGKHEIGMKNNMIFGKNNINAGKVTEEKKKIDIRQFSAGKVLQEKLDLSKVKINKEKKLFKGQFFKLYEDTFNLDENFNLDDFVIEKVEEQQANLENVNVEIQNDGRLDLNMEELLQDNNRNLVPDDGNDGENLEMELLREPVGEYIEDDSDDDILEEFLNAEKEKLANIEMKKRAVANLVNAAHINDAKLTELLQEAYDHKIEIIKGKKATDIQSPERETTFAKRIISPPESKYCMSNLSCKMCDMKFRDLKALKIHFARTHRYKIKTPAKRRLVKIKMCDLCGRKFTNSKSMVRHLKTHDKPKEFFCDKCPLSFTSEHNLNNHKRTHTKLTRPENKLNGADPRYVCKICGAVNSSASNHATHERRHSKSYSLHCELCGRGFYRRSELVTHNRQHTGEKPFPCAFCDRCFSRRDTLNRHLKRHTDERMYSCQFCSKSFAKSYDVKVHQMKNKNCLQLLEKELSPNNMIQVN